jgi:hypothetical protein
MKINTNELTDIALDWAVAECKYPDLVWGSSIGIHHASHQIVIPHLPEPQCYWNPSTDWAQGGPIIEREKIGIDCDDQGVWFASYDLSAETAWGATGTTPLVAAMRCYVASKLGKEIDIPEELI